jgi:hypothetical protein
MCGKNGELTNSRLSNTSAHCFLWRRNIASWGNVAALGTVHELLGTKGRKDALEAGIERSVVEAAAAYLSDEDSGFRFSYAG